LLREMRDLQRSHLDEYRRFTSEALRVASESEARQQRAAEQPRRADWPRLTALIVYSLVLIGAGVVFASIVNDLARRVTP
jgi:hypothetical protein